jgi:anti-sigma-K factor RskA
MHDSELKKLLLETCPVRPGQEGRAWSALRDRLYQAKPARSRFLSRLSWLYHPTWRGLVVAAVALALIPVTGNFFVGGEPIGLATADSQSPGIYATAFYSRTAQAQVVWLNGMDPATDKPTYLDPTTVVTGTREAPHPTGDPNSL